MNCRKCRKEFCWICMQDWTLHSDNTGGYFQCNRFVANLKVGDLPEGSGVGELWAEESGNAHAETLRLREKNKRMARFIHHFTRYVHLNCLRPWLLFLSTFSDAHLLSFFFCRYKAHSDSVKLEGRMFSETARRIHEGLLASMDGGSLKWLQGYQAPHPLMVADADTPASSPRNRAPSPLPDAAPLSLPVSGEKGAATVSESSAAAPVRTKKKHFTDATAFLKDGFEELLKCRCVSAPTDLLHRILNSPPSSSFPHVRFCNGHTRMHISSLRTTTTTTIQGNKFAHSDIESLISRITLPLRRCPISQESAAAAPGPVPARPAVRLRPAAVGTGGDCGDPL